MRFSPTLDEARELATEPCVFPVWTKISADEQTPVTVFLRLTQGGSIHGSFLLESVSRGETNGRWSFVGFDNKKMEILGEDPLNRLQSELEKTPYKATTGAPPFTGGAIGYLSFESVHYFEPKTKPQSPLKDNLGVPEAAFLLADKLVAFDHLYSVLYVIRMIHHDQSSDLNTEYATALKDIENIVESLSSSKPIIQVQDPGRQPGVEYKSHMDASEEDYKRYVTELKKHIVSGDIIQGVPSRRVLRPTPLHPFNVYRKLRASNPSPYMFYIDLHNNVHLVGASPECLCKVEDNVVTNHAIAGTVRRGKTEQEDLKLAKELKASVKDRAEHVMLVDLARNDVNRVCDPKTVKVDSLMEVERFSHVMHLTSQISGVLRPDKNRFDALRSIFPAGTVSGAPKIKAIQLIQQLENQTRGPYAGAVGHFDYSPKDMDTCIALRAMLFKNGVAHLQSGGGIVYDSDEHDEFIETVNKLASNVTCISNAEEDFLQV